MNYVKVRCSVEIEFETDDYIMTNKTRIQEALKKETLKVKSGILENVAVGTILRVNDIYVNDRKI